MDKLKSFIPLNFNLMSNPVNWVIIALMILIAGLALNVIMTGATTTENE